MSEFKLIFGGCSQSSIFSGETVSEIETFGFLARLETTLRCQIQTKSLVVAILVKAGSADNCSSVWNKQVLSTKF